MQESVTVLEQRGYFLAAPVLSLVVAAGLMSGVLEAVPAPCVIFASGDWAAALVDGSDGVLVALLELSAAPGVVVVLVLGVVLVELPAGAPMFASCAIAAVPSRAATTMKEVFSITLTFGLETATTPAPFPGSRDLCDSATTRRVSRARPRRLAGFHHFLECGAPAIML
jgi:hypothetical protein